MTWPHSKSKEPVRVTRNETILLWALGAVVFGIVNYLGYGWLSTKQTALDHQYRGLRADQAEAKVDLVELDLWAQRKTWIAEHEPPLGNEGDAKAQLLEAVLKGARDNKLEIMEQSLNDAEPGPAGTKVNVSVKVKGSMEGLARWLTDLEKPDQFYAVSSFVLRADQDEKSMICTLQVARYFKNE
jgi:hypothetical protein